MNTLKLVFSRVKDDIRNHPFIMLLYYIGSILCVLAFIISYNNVQNSFNSFQHFLNSIEFREYKINLNEEAELKKEDFNFLSDYDIENISCSTSFTDNYDNIYEVRTFSSIEYIYDVESRLKDNKTVAEVFNNSEYFSKNVIFSSNSGSDKVKMSDGSEFEICRIPVTYNYITFDKFTENNLKTTNIVITTKTLHNSFENSEIKNLILENLGHYGITSVETMNDNNRAMEELYSMINTFVVVFLILLICFIGCAAMFKYVFNLNRYENVIYCLLGASKKRVTAIIILEAFIISVISSVSAIIIHAAAYDTYFKKIDYSGLGYAVSDYIIVAVFTVILSLATIIPFFVSYMRSPVMQMKEKYS